MDISQTARELAPEAMSVLHEVATDGGAKGSERVAAANSILDRAYGKPVQATISVPVSQSAAAKLAGLDDSALLALIAAKRQASGFEPVAFCDEGVTPALPSPTRQVEMGRRTYTQVESASKKRLAENDEFVEGVGVETEQAPLTEFEMLMSDPLLA